MPQEVSDWLASIGASNIDVMIIFMGVAVVAWVWNTIRRLEQRDREDKKSLWKETKEVRRLYHQVDKLCALNSLAIRTITKGKIVTMKQSADGKGDHALNRDV
jgi:uncharacterized membrane protein YcjF (UPF0283 family)